MEKLIPLLNERHNLEWVLGSSRENGDYLFVKGDKENKFYEEQIISKKFGFIKWLVENDKIDLEKERNKEFKRIDFDLAEGMDGYEITTEDVFLMWLSIQDEPIRFLCEILK